ncbi:unnamed protein product (macronuclear) [Paramecium tetraurelia]|uniref:Uncharacterized protein n=1 Tax=Paramecium tetraurelia TaxID=5888 RepID=A0DPI0_PARTE|nr:uncharacterized protein GSPATT00019129001 [Paramecium tetraurelia]CAK84947.1 unnamed protein product [Paramecium tetraurelia]|eukprot:XP_001452344.1 hypothetical protein (macronuclear) [Paramecium tetraurelia strain d4-2]
MENREQDVPATENPVAEVRLEDKLNEIQEVGEKGINEIEKYYKITGSPINNAIIVQVLICALASGSTALVNSLGPVQWLISLIPVFNLLNFIIYAVFLAFLQFGSPFFKKKPWNFLFFGIHFIGKFSFMVFYGVNYPLNKFEVFYFLCVFGYLYVLALVRNRDAGLNGVDFTIKGNFFQLAGLGIFLGFFLALLTQAGFWPMIWQPIVGVLYFLYLLLEVQRFDGSLDYLREGKNALFLGAAQIDADLLWFCPLAIFHIKSKGEVIAKKSEEFAQEAKEETKQLINPEQNA